MSVAREPTPGHDEVVRRDRLHYEDQVRPGDAAGRECGLDTAKTRPRKIGLVSLRRAAQAAARDRAGIYADGLSGRFDAPAADALEHRVGRPRRAESELVSHGRRRSGCGRRYGGTGPAVTGAAARARAERRGDEQT